MLPTYVDYVRKNNIDPEVLINAINNFKTLRGFIEQHIKYNNVEQDKSLTQSLMPLLGAISEGVVKDTKDKKYLTDKLFSLVCEFKSSHIYVQEELANTISKHYFQLDESNEGLLMIVNSKKDESMSIPLPYYFVLKVTNDNPKYFEDRASKMISVLESSNNDDERISVMNNLSQIFTFFTLLPKLGDSHSYADEINKLSSKVKKWSEEQIEDPITETFLSTLRKEKIKVGIQLSGERFVRKKTWVSLNTNINKIIAAKPLLRPEFVVVVRERLANDEGPFLRRLDYETLEALTHISDELVRKNHLVKLVQENMSTEESPQVLQDFGKILANAQVSECMNEFEVRKFDFQIGLLEGHAYEGPHLLYGVFIKLLEKYSEGEMSFEQLLALGNKRSEEIGEDVSIDIISLLYPKTQKGNDSDNTIKIDERDIKDLSKKRLTSVQLSNIDCIRILHWDFDLISEHLPCFDSESKDDHIRARKLWVNAFVTLASDASNFHNYFMLQRRIAPHGEFHAPIEIIIDRREQAQTYRKSIVAILEKEFERNYMYLPEEEWGTCTGALIEAIKNLGEPNEVTKQKIQNLKALLFGDYSSVFGTYETSLIIREKQERDNFKPLDALSPAEYKDLKECKNVRDKFNETREKFAEKVLDFAPDESLGTYKRHLIELGYSEYDLDKILEKKKQSYEMAYK